MLDRLHTRWMKKGTRYNQASVRLAVIQCFAFLMASSGLPDRRVGATLRAPLNLRQSKSGMSRTFQDPKRVHLLIYVTVAASLKEPSVGQMQRVCLCNERLGLRTWTLCCVCCSACVLHGTASLR